MASHHTPAPLIVGRSILVIDDDALMREFVSEILSAAGYAVIHAASITAGLKRACEEQPALVLSDVVMTGGDGFALLNALSQAPSTAGIPVVFMTAAGDNAAMRRAMSLGAVDFLKKPFSAELLLSVVGVQLRRLADLQARARRSLESARLSLDEIIAPLDDIVGCAEIIKSHIQDGPHAEVLIHMAYAIAESARHVQRRTEYILARSESRPVPAFRENAPHAVSPAPAGRPKRAKPALSA
jgi:two-component system, sensor histidine kinase and response regulator